SFLGTGLVGAAAAAALVVPGAVSAPDSGDRPAPPVAGASGGPATTAAPAARDILLAAATRAEEAPVRTGKYWHVRKELVSGPIRVGTKPDTYYVMQREVDESWQARDAAGDSWYGRRSLGVRPRAAADEAAWRAAGSPTTWNQGPSDSADKRDLILSTRPSRGELVKAGPDEPRGERGPLDHRWDAVRRLPTDDNELRDRILQGIRLDADFPAGSESENVRLFGEMTGLLLDAPAPPKVRAAAFRVLAGIPGVRSLGEADDAAGRPGLAVEMSTRSNGIAWSYQIIVDADTHVLLGHTVSSRRGGSSVPVKEQSALVFAAEWTDAQPRIPAV
ncbi:MAG TPA: CU044_5270 family protein, partial [Actinoplanes sp.]